MAEITTIVGPENLVRGRVTGDEDVLVEGRVEGEIALSRTLYVEASGIVIADVRVDQAVIGGTLVGDVRADTAVQVTATGRVVGAIHAPRVVISEGAQLRADLDTEQGSPQGATSGAQARTATQPASWSSPAASPATVGRASSVVGQALAARPERPAAAPDRAVAAVSQPTGPAPRPHESGAAEEDNEKKKSSDR